MWGKKKKSSLMGYWYSLCQLNCCWLDAKSQLTSWGSVSKNPYTWVFIIVCHAPPFPFGEFWWDTWCQGCARWQKLLEASGCMGAISTMVAWLGLTLQTILASFYWHKLTKICNHIHSVMQTWSSVITIDGGLSKSSLKLVYGWISTPHCFVWR